jgi:hypothetical protein
MTLFLSVGSRVICGIIITMLYNDHSPPHFYAQYGDYKVIVEILSGIVDGRFPKRALHSLMEWYEIYKDNLLEDWNLAARHEPLNKIPPLE